MAKKKSISRCLLNNEVYCESVTHCRHCGWWPEENERRKELPLVLRRDGLYRKIIRREK